MTPFTYDYPRPMVTVDCIITSLNNEGALSFLLIQRKNDPFQDMWALPGGFVDMDEDLHDAATRELEEETGLQLKTMNQFATYGKPGRDPRGRTISVVFFASVAGHPVLRGGDDASDAQWFIISELPELAFDHSLIIQDFLKTI
jgi:8-oxo-dGTP diphosphatase